MGNHSIHKYHKTLHHYRPHQVHTRRPKNHQGLTISYTPWGIHTYPLLNPYSPDTPYLGYDFYEPPAQTALTKMHEYNAGDVDAQRDLEQAVQGAYAKYQPFVQEVLRYGSKMEVRNMQGQVTNTFYTYRNMGVVELRDQNHDGKAEEIVIKKQDETGDMTVVGTVGLSYTFDQVARNASPSVRQHIEDLVDRIAREATGVMAV